MTKLTSSQLIFFSKKVMSLFEKFSIDNSILLMMSGGHMNFPFIVSGNIKLSPNVREDISIMLIIGAIRVCSPISFKYISFWCLFSKPLAPPPPPPYIEHTIHTTQTHKCSIERGNWIRHVYNSGIHKNGCMQGVMHESPKMWWKRLCDDWQRHNHAKHKRLCLTNQSMTI